MKGLTVAQLADAKGFTVEELAAFGVADGESKSGAACVDIPYRALDGSAAPVKKRLKLDEPGRFWWPKGKPTMPYGLERVAALPADAPIWLVEGESDAWTLWLNGFPALGVPGATSWKPDYAALLAGHPVFAWQEPGAAGITFVSTVTSDLPDARVIRGSADAKDPNAAWLWARRDAVLFGTTMQVLMSHARTRGEEAAAERDAAAAAALAASGGLLDDPDLLRHVEREIVEWGYAR